MDAMVELFELLDLADECGLPDTQVLQAGGSPDMVRAAALLAARAPIGMGLALAVTRKNKSRAMRFLELDKMYPGFHPSHVFMPCPAGCDECKHNGDMCTEHMPSWKDLAKEK